MIHIEALTKYYKNFCAVDQISFDIHKGEILGLLGPNGAGKTTTLRMLTGYLEPTDGSVRVKDYQIDKNALEIKRLIGYLPESAPLYHDMIVYDYLNYVAGIRNLPRDKRVPRIRELADLCGLNNVMHKTIGVLSKGYKQRVGLAHAMMDDPEILVLDEPTSGLDPNQIVEIRDIIRRIGKEKTIILSTHILPEAEATCDRVVIIHQGKIVADGSTETLKQSAGNESLIHLKLQNADAQAAQQALASVDGVNELLPAASENGVLELKLSCEQQPDLMGRIYAAVKATDWVLLEFYQETRTLENIFRELTKEN
jgi:gliding motility-associated transport system ATP-binding protein